MYTLSSFHLSILTYGTVRRIKSKIQLNYSIINFIYTIIIWRKWFFFSEDDDSTDLQRKILEDLWKLICSDNVYDAEVHEWIKEASKWDCYQASNDNDINWHVAFCSEKKEGITKYFFKNIKQIS